MCVSCMVCLRMCCFFRNDSEVTDRVVHFSCQDFLRPEVNDL